MPETYSRPWGRPSEDDEREYLAGLLMNAMCERREILELRCQALLESGLLSLNELSEMYPVERQRILRTFPEKDVPEWPDLRRSLKDPSVP